DAIVLLSPRRANDKRLAAALEPLIGAIPVDLMRAANLRASTKNTLPKDVAAWLWQAVQKEK
ncbi:MAG: ABC transporter permease, partial [Acidobacteriota bacterium]